jgi:hypothetical protein
MEAGKQQRKTPATMQFLRFFELSMGTHGRFIELISKQHGGKIMEKWRDIGSAGRCARRALILFSCFELFLMGNSHADYE